MKTNKYVGEKCNSHAAAYKIGGEYFEKCRANINTASVMDNLSRRD